MWEKDKFLEQIVLEQKNNQRQTAPPKRTKTKELRPIFHTICKKINSKCITDPNAKCHKTKKSRKNIGENLSDLRFGKVFLYDIMHDP